MRQLGQLARWIAGLALCLGATAGPAVVAADAPGPVAEKLLLDNDRVMVFDYIFPAGFRGDEHAAVADEFAYVLDGEFTVVTRGVGKRVVRRGEIEYAAKGTIHMSSNDAKKPARVLVVLMKER